MANLTRIKNNQITDSTILANTKIVPGSIVGSLFNSSMTIASDITITGNLTVQGSSSYLTVASTNTYVNDPLIVLNNAFSGTNTYDIGLLFNRGNQTTTALIWKESNKQFELTYTTETGTGYGAINNSGYANLYVGNLTVAAVSTLSSVNVLGNIAANFGTFSGDVLIGGGDLTANTTTFSLLNSTVTTLNFGGAVTSANVGAGTGTFTINNPTLVGQQPTQNLYNTVATTMNFAGAATALNMGAASGTVSLNNANVWVPNATTISGSQATIALLNVNATTVNAFGAATALNMGAASGTVSLNNANVWVPNAATIAGAQATVALLNVNATTVNAFGAATAIGIGAGTGTTTINNQTLSLPNATSVTVGQTSVAFANTTATTVNAFGAATTLNLAAATGTTTIRNNLSNGGNIAINSGTNSTSATTGALTVTGGIGLTGNLYIGLNAVIGGNLTVQGTTTYVNSTNLDVQDNIIELNTGANGAALSGATLNDVGIRAHYFNVTDKSMFFGRSNTSGNFEIFSDATETTGNISGTYGTVKTGNIILTGTSNTTSAITGALQVAGGVGIAQDLFVGGGDITTDQATFNLLNASTTTLNFGGAVTSANVGAGTGTFTINNPTLVGQQPTQALYNTIATTMNFAGAATTITIGATTGTANIRNALTTITGVANILATTDSTQFNNGALVVNGGVGSAGNIHIKSTKQLVVGQDLAGEVFLPDATAQFFSNVSGYSQINQQNISSNTFASSDFIATANNGNDIQGFIDLGINSNTYSQSTFTITKANDGYLYVQGNATTGGGNLAIGTGASNDIIFFTGGTLAANEVARFNNTSGNLQLKQTTAATSQTTGALTVAGGAGFAKNVYVANGTTINNAQSAEDFVVKGKISTALIYANSNADSVVIGGGHFGGSGGNTTIQGGVTLKVDATDTMLLPVGTTAQRPSNSGNVDVKGMTRFNSTINNVEFYDGTIWQSTGSAFTVISARQFAGATGGLYGNVDGSNAVFTIQSSSTAAATIVSINGVVQIPVLAYDVSTTTLTFTEAPALGDVIDVRCLTSTTTVTQIASSNGLNQFIVDTDGAQIWSGTSGTIQRVNVDPAGVIQLVNGTKIGYNQTAVALTVSAATIDSFPLATYRSAKYIATFTNGTTSYETTELILIHDGTTATRVQYGTVSTTGASLVTYSATISGGNVLLQAATVSGTGTIKVLATYIKV